jgi:hypothetical protein
MRTRLIVLIDFSPNSEPLLELANVWCKEIEADIVLVHRLSGRVPILLDDLSRKQIIESEKEQAIAELELIAKKTCSESTKITYHVFEQDLTTSLPLLLRTGYYHLILTGLKESGILKQIFLGSTIIQLIEDLNIPLLAAPLKLKPFIPKKVVAAINYRFPLHEEAFDKVLYIFQNHIKQLEFISIITANDSEIETIDYLEHLKYKYARNLIVATKSYKGEDAFKEIKTYMQKNEDSILVVQRGSRTLTDQLFRNFLINDLVYDAITPLIVIPS